MMILLHFLRLTFDSDRLRKKEEEVRESEERVKSEKESGGVGGGGVHIL